MAVEPSVKILSTVPFTFFTAKKHLHFFISDRIVKHLSTQTYKLEIKKIQP